MNIADWIDRLRDDESLTADLRDEDAARLLAWGEERLAVCITEEEALTVIADVRAIARAVGAGGVLDELIASRDRPRSTSGSTEPDAGHGDPTGNEQE